MRVSAAQRREQLIAATVELMRRDGVGSVTLRAIAEAAHAPLATVHYCFRDKDELVTAAVDYWLRLMVDDMAAGADGFGGLAATMDRIAERFWEGLENNSADVLAQLEVITWAVREQPESGLARSIYERYANELSALFSKAMADGSEDSSVPVDELARAFLVLIDGCSFQALADPSGSKYRNVYRHLAAGLVSGALTRQ